MKADDLQALQLIAGAGRVDLNDPRLSLTQRLALLPVLEQLFDRGLLTIHPPGHRYSINAEGRVALAAATALVAPAQEKAA